MPTPIETKKKNIAVSLPNNARRVLSGDQFVSESFDGRRVEAIAAYNRMLGIQSIGPNYTGTTPVHDVQETDEPAYVPDPIPYSDAGKLQEQQQVGQFAAFAGAIAEAVAKSMGQHVGAGVAEAITKVLADKIGTAATASPQAPQQAAQPAQSGQKAQQQSTSFRVAGK